MTGQRIMQFASPEERNRSLRNLWGAQFRMGTRIFRHFPLARSLRCPSWQRQVRGAMRNCPHAPANAIQGGNNEQFLRSNPTGNLCATTARDYRAGIARLCPATGMRSPAVASGDCVGSSQSRMVERMPLVVEATLRHDERAWQGLGK